MIKMFGEQCCVGINQTFPQMCVKKVGLFCAASNLGGNTLGKKSAREKICVLY